MQMNEGHLGQDSRVRAQIKWMWLLRALAVVSACAVMCVVATQTGRYVARAVWSEAMILARRRPIAELVANPATTPAVAHKLTLVLAARAFGG